MKLYTAILLLSGIILFTKVHAQVEGLDSLEKTILESVQKGLEKKGTKNYLGDSIDFLKFKSPVDLDAIFKDLNKTLSTAKSVGDINKLRGGYYKLSTMDSLRGNYKGAYENYKLYTLYRDSLQKKEAEKKELETKMQYEFDKKQAIAKAEQEKKDAEQKRIKNIQFFTIAGLVLVVLVVLLIALIQWKNNQQKKKANVLLQQQNEKVESALSELKSTQASLIHSEKMASLGELTAGIAHEIQNPLNFVNNFGEVNNELIHEIANENDIHEIKAIANDIRQNNEKIVFHGKRADEIVKGMLQHSRTSTGVKESTNINLLCDEYLRIAYHGMAAKEKDFKGEFKTDFDDSIGNISIIPQDIGRVLLNLYNNAFFAVNEKRILLQTQDEKYEPTVMVSTKRQNGKVVIAVTDNGNGIPQNIIDKIFQPFFTTKPTGQGTGLGLSLSYDIVKAHGGELNVESEQGKGSKFEVSLPLT
ncbi:MAG: ATP-binding protein [Chitinophagaceae bacterium]